MSSSSSDLKQLELLSLTSAITKELINHTSLNDSTLAEFLIHLHTTSTNYADFKDKVNQVGAQFPESFLASVDRLVLSMHPKYKKKLKKKSQSSKTKNNQQPGSTAFIDEEKQRQIRLFPGLALPDQEWQPSNSLTQDKPAKSSDTAAAAAAADQSDQLGVDTLMAQLERVNERSAPSDNNRDGKRSRDDRSRSPPDRNRRPRSPDYDRRPGPPGRDGYGRQDRGRDGYNGGGRGDRAGPRRLEDHPVMYKIYPGKVSSMKDFGAFISLEGVAGRAEGNCPCESQTQDSL